MPIVFHLIRRLLLGIRTARTSSSVRRLLVSSTSCRNAISMRTLGVVTFFAFQPHFTSLLRVGPRRHQSATNRSRILLVEINRHHHGMRAALARRCGFQQCQGDERAADKTGERDVEDPRQPEVLRDIAR